MTRHPEWVGLIGGDCPGERGPGPASGGTDRKPVCAGAASPGEAPLLVVGWGSPCGSVPILVRRQLATRGSGRADRRVLSEWLTRAGFSAEPLRWFCGSDGRVVVEQDARWVDVATGEEQGRGRVASQFLVDRDRNPADRSRKKARRSGQILKESHRITGPDPGSTPIQERHHNTHRS